MAGKDKVEVIVTSNEASAKGVQQFAERLREAGMEVTNVLDFIGQVSGFIPKADADKLRRIKGVASVEVSGKVELPPSDEEVQ